MKKILGILVVLCLTTTLSAAENSFYIGIHGGYEKSKQDISGGSQHLSYEKNFPALGVSLGKDINSHFRTELAYTYKSAKDKVFDFRGENGEIDAGDLRQKITQQTTLVNLFFYPFETKSIQPFIGVGVGIGWLEIEKIDRYQKFAYAGYLGADYIVSEHFVVNLMGTYNSIASYKHFDNNQNWGAAMGARYYF